MNLSEFLDGFAAAAGIDRAEADEQWAGFSRSLSDRTREHIERGGRAAGDVQGNVFREIYGTTEREEVAP